MSSAKAKGGRPGETFESFGLSKKQLAETIGVAPEALYKASRLGAPRTTPARLARTALTVS